MRSLNCEKKIKTDSLNDTVLAWLHVFLYKGCDTRPPSPEVNARIEGNEVVTQQFYDIGVAVSTDKGLMVPVLRDCDQKGFAEIEGDIISYAKAARDGKIQMSNLEGGVFTISNGGIYGSMLSTPIINYPQPAILGLHNITERAVLLMARSWHDL